MVPKDILLYPQISHHQTDFFPQQMGAGTETHKQALFTQRESLRWSSPSGSFPQRCGNPMGEGEKRINESEEM